MAAAGAVWNERAGCFEEEAETGNTAWQKIITFAESPHEEEKPGTMRAVQCWLQKVEYGGMQNKMLLKSSLETQLRISKAVCNLERRQDHQMSEPQDWLRHWRACENGPERKLPLAAATRKHMEAGVCCLPSCMVWLWTLRVAKKAMKIWESQPAPPGARRRRGS